MTHLMGGTSLIQGGITPLLPSVVTTASISMPSSLVKSLERCSGGFWVMESAPEDSG